MMISEYVFILWTRKYTRNTRNKQGNGAKKCEKSAVSGKIV